MDRRERLAIMSEGAIRPETARDRRERDGLEQDVADSPLAGKPVERRLRNFSADPARQLAALAGPLAWMTRLREIEVQTQVHEAELERAWRELAAECGHDRSAFAARWRATAERWNFVEVNDLIDRHNRYFPAEARLPMDVRTGDFALVNGRPYSREPLDDRWILERFPDEAGPAAA